MRIWSKLRKRQKPKEYLIGNLCASRNRRKLPPKLKTIISEMYMAAANEMTGQKLFNAPLLAQVIAEYRDYTKE